jgi:hypothetical protein
MGQEDSGLTNSQYAYWLNETAAQDCGDVASIYIKYTNNSTQTITDEGDICTWMESTDSVEVASLQEVKFSGTNGEGDWYATDMRVSVNLERTVNFADVPINIRRPTGS